MDEPSDDALLHAWSEGDLRAGNTLVRRGMPFRTAHELSGRIVRDLYESGRDFSSLSLEDWQRYDPIFDDRVFAAITPEAAVAARVTPQSTGPSAVAAALAETKTWISAHMKA